jgi:hypothetical protein
MGYEKPIMVNHCPSPGEKERNIKRQESKENCKIEAPFLYHTKTVTSRLKQQK